jgi:hypothetical protein
MRYCSPMREDEYYRLHTACLAMVGQSASPEVQARWLAMVEAWLKGAIELRQRNGGALTTQARLPNTSTSVGLQRLGRKP